MKKELHPELKKVTATCVTCNTSYEIFSTKSEVKLDICGACHPFYTGSSTSNSKAGRVERFNKRLNNPSK